MNAILPLAVPANEPVRAYAPGSPEKASLKRRLDEMLHETVDIPLIIGGREVRTGDTAKAVCPHDHATPSTPPPCSTSRRPCTRPRSTPPAS